CLPEDRHAQRHARAGRLCGGAQRQGLCAGSAGEPPAGRARDACARPPRGGARAGGLSTPYGLRPPPQGGDTSGPAEPDPRCPLGLLCGRRRYSTFAPACTQRPSAARSPSVICVALFSGMVFATTACWYSACAFLAISSGVSRRTFLFASPALWHIAQRWLTMPCTCAKPPCCAADAGVTGADADTSLRSGATNT